jgi:hypothetical protein
MLFTNILLFFLKNKFNESKKTIFCLILGIFALVNLLYFTNLIPPIPLSLKDAGVYHFIQRNDGGNYDVTYEDSSWKDYFNLYPDYKEVAGSPVYAYSAIFSPRELNISIVHEWQYYDETQHKWITNMVVSLPVIGGRDGGFRTYSMRSSLFSGRWRVNIKTAQGQIIGRLRFKVISVNTEPTLIHGVKK